jgi:osmotically-inducible protein OsmY
MKDGFMQRTDLPPGKNADGDLKRRVSNYLASRYFPALNQLEIEAEAGIVTLRGCVSSFYEKQVAITSCQRVAGVLQLVDAVDVHR